MKSISIIIFLFISTNLISQTWQKIQTQPEELGNIKWLRSYPEAIKKAKVSKKPIFIQFQEVPGCSTCRNYGNNLLTHPHIVEALETFFVPLAIYNNKAGEDASILKKFNEPSWNNPVARVIDAESEEDIVRRLNGRYDMQSLIQTINNAILKSGNLVPTYLSLLEKEYSITDPRETHLSMYCFWSGEINFADLDGVIATRAGYMNGAEVVKVIYDAEELNEKKLIRYANKTRCGDAIFTKDKREIKAAKSLHISTQNPGKFRPDKQPKYYIYNSDLKYIPMTNLQALKVNAALSHRQSYEEYLSPRQVQLLTDISKMSNKKIAIDKDFATTWNSYLR